MVLESWVICLCFRVVAIACVAGHSEINSSARTVQINTLGHINPSIGGRICPVQVSEKRATVPGMATLEVATSGVGNSESGPLRHKWPGGLVN